METGRIANLSPARLFWKGSRQNGLFKEIVKCKLFQLNYILPTMYLNTDLNLTSKRLWKSLYCANADVFFPSASHFNIVRDLTKMGKAFQHSCNVSLTTKCFSLQHRARRCKQKYFRKWLRKQHPAVCLSLSDEGWCGVDCLTLGGVF